MDNNKFDADSYYGNSNNNGYYGQNNNNNDNENNNKNNNKSNSNYDDLFKSYGEDGKIAKKKKKREKQSKGEKKSWKIIVIIVLLLMIFACVGVLAYTNRDKIKNIIDPDKNVAIDVQVQDSNIAMIVGNTQKLRYIMTNSNDVKLLTFASSDTSVAKVDSEGNIKAVGAGQAIISVSYMGEKGKITKTCYVTIKNVAVTENQPVVTKSADEIRKEAEETRKKQIEEDTKKMQQRAKEIAEAENRKHAEEAAKKSAEAAAAAQNKNK